MRSVKFVIPGPPVGKGRPRFSTRGGFVKTYTPEKTVTYEKIVQQSYKEQCGDVFFDKEIPLRLIAIAYFPIPKSTSKKMRQLMVDGKIRPIKKPDVSNILKCWEDGCNGVAYYDDAQIVEITVSRYYAEEPRTEVIISEVET